ncbi:hypothetical protein RND71_007791 [Anisodus tanguticus]|uniref:Coenzyme Q-binding protein COQ10 START domain-containing protein n=1 Tax=Anisodus tanguticus TaxID=243964 RepID=A0AAE1SNC1_9SOLA|nr:hypothetical protein RND71_007791 [Anisodus tanguticus]
MALMPIFSSSTLRQMSATAAVPASTTMSGAATSVSASSATAAVHILNYSIVSLHGKRKSISASSSSFISRYSFNCDISRSFRRISYPSPIRIRPLSPVMEWQDCTVKSEVDVPISVAYKCYSDREAIPEWMPFISSVKDVIKYFCHITEQYTSVLHPVMLLFVFSTISSSVSVRASHHDSTLLLNLILRELDVRLSCQILEDKPDLSRWSLKYKAFGQNIEYSWLARNMQPTPNQKIHWRSLEGLPNRGAVRFFPKGPSSCIIELTVSYEVPQLLVPVASVSTLTHTLEVVIHIRFSLKALKPFLENLLDRGLERFARFAKSYSADMPK